MFIRGGNRLNPHNHSLPKLNSAVSTDAQIFFNSKMPNPLILFEHELNRIDSHVANHKLEILGNLKYRENLPEFGINFLNLFLDDILDGQQLRIFAECQNKILMSHIANWCLIVCWISLSF